MYLLLKSIFGFWLFWGSPATPSVAPGHEGDFQAQSPLICIRKDGSKTDGLWGGRDN